jgi:hypothetical protein
VCGYVAKWWWLGNERWVSGLDAAAPEALQRAPQRCQGPTSGQTPKTTPNLTGQGWFGRGVVFWTCFEVGFGLIGWFAQMVLGQNRVGMGSFRPVLDHCSGHRNAAKAARFRCTSRQPASITRTPAAHTWLDTVGSSTASLAYSSCTLDELSVARALFQRVNSPRISSSWATTCERGASSAGARAARSGMGESPRALDAQAQLGPPPGGT